jgi:membrane protein implicated in regulation of membrane protease activity
MPAIGLVVFIFLPFPQALAVYLPVAIISLALFYAIYRSMNKPVSAGLEGIAGGTGEVVSRLELVSYKGELWTAKSQANLGAGEQVRVVSLAGIKLVVERAEGEEQIAQTG